MKRSFFFRDKHGMMICTVAVGKHVNMFNFIKKMSGCLYQTKYSALENQICYKALPEAQLRFLDNHPATRN